MRHESPENGRYGDETPAPALGDPHAENGPHIALTPREVAQVEAALDGTPMPPEVSAFLDAKVREDLDAWLGRVEW